jgi:diguanylate cyclase (GGDEF)-like protein
MRRHKSIQPIESIPSRSRAIAPVAVVCGAIWVATVLTIAGDLQGAAELALALGGVLATLTLLILIAGNHARMRNLDVTDALTGLANHRGFHETLASEIDRATELNRPVALVAIDLDNFKAVNDTLGHPCGDRILNAVGPALRRAVRLNDTPARIGGEEFALILPGADGSTAFAVAERAREEIARIQVEGLELTCSAGIAGFPHDAEDAGTLCQLAEDALQWAKQGGKRRSRRFDPEHSPASWTDRQRAEIVDLLEREQPVAPVFQPVVNLATGRIVGYEALARFEASGRRSPDIWFAQAHGCGLGAELEAAAIRAALAPTGRPLDAHLAINLSPTGLGSAAVASTLQGSLEGLVIEITEHEFVPDDESLAATIADLRRRGAKVAVDDAGAGHAGLKQLMRVKPDIVKLDRDLIREIHRDPARTALVESFVRFARDVGATVCAEGIEKLEELEVLADLDVQWGQGYVLARPAPPWAGVSPAAAELCREALAETFRSLPAEGGRAGSSDRRLVHVSGRLAGARTRSDLESALALIAAELSATKVCLSAWHGDEGVLETLAENGERSTSQTTFAIDEYPLSARVCRRQEAVQVIVGDPTSDPREAELLLALGERSLLMVPVVTRGQTLGIIEAYRGDERAWSRAEINRARVVANQLAAAIPMLAEATPEPRSEPAASPRATVGP